VRASFFFLSATARWSRGEGLSSSLFLRGLSFSGT
jgi:hypothetical protein